MDTNHQIIGYNVSFTPEECDVLIRTATELGLAKNYDYTHLNAGEFDSFRPRNVVQNNTVALPRDKCSWVYDRLNYILQECNSLFLFDIDRIEEVYVIRYDVGDHYRKHHDLLMEMNGSRKLSISVQLSEPEDYVGGDLILHTGEEPYHASTIKGAGTMFVATIVHEITTVSKGHRYSLVTHYSGPKWR